ncbi:D-alanine--D-alanine ligase [Desulfonatronum thiosulfatophilum]|uniref:D-alanine--D-alanine ligase n=1 Tax=Desulfonatronum thiosulfatophilum TaxID=617002 RepID=A0A1G6A8E2_9BACT|nr:D-alanine--D-alanine ligase [Desulfonatronum thiosulfatophilum]SDB04649.1 D-alanine--D-alanine ligase [Desulfonatronum thiosulfatophilum]
MRILLIAGGWSDERQVSLAGAGPIEVSLRRQGHSVAMFDPLAGLGKLPHLVEDFDFVFINLHGAPGEDGLIQAMLDRLGKPYQGSGPAGSMLALNKAASKSLFHQNNLSTPPWFFIPQGPSAEEILPFKPPYVVKPNLGGSSLGIEVVRLQSEFMPAVERILAQGREVLVEQYQPGLEVTCGILGDEALPLILIRPGEESSFFDYKSKYVPGQAEEVCPAPLAGDICRGIQAMALHAHRILGLHGYSRADFILHEGQAYLLEVNTLPGMTATSLLPQAAAVHGLDFDHLLARLIELGLEKKPKEQLS